MRSCESAQRLNYAIWYYGFLRVSKVLDGKLRIYIKFRFCSCVVLRFPGLEGSGCEVANLRKFLFLFVGFMAFFGSRRFWWRSGASTHSFDFVNLFYCDFWVLEILVAKSEDVSHDREQYMIKREQQNSYAHRSHTKRCHMILMSNTSGAWQLEPRCLTSSAKFFTLGLDTPIPGVPKDKNRDI